MSDKMSTKKQPLKRLLLTLYFNFIVLCYLHFLPIKTLATKMNTEKISREKPILIGKAELLKASNISQYLMASLPLFDGQSAEAFKQELKAAINPKRVTSSDWSLVELLRTQNKRSHPPNHEHKSRGLKMQTKRRKRFSCISRNLLYTLKEFSSNVVLLSSGCSGTLISPSFVLTAAHCVHNGRSSHKNLQVAIQGLTSNNRIHYVKKVIVPKGWMLIDNSMNTERYVNDYAMLELVTSATGRREFMRFEAPSRNTLSSDMYFMGFSFRHEPKFGLNTCPWETGRTFLNHNLITRVCGAGSGHSGASVFTHSKRRGYSISGIVSHARIAKSNKAQQNLNEWTVITALTQPKIDFICSILSLEVSDVPNACWAGSNPYTSSGFNFIF